MILRVLVVVGASALVAGVLVGCGDDDPAAPTTTTDATTTSETTPTTDPPTTDPPTASDATTTSEPGILTVQVFFLDEDAFAVGRLPYLRPVQRTAATLGAELASLELLFEGPTADETDAGLRFVASEASGIASFDIVDRTAHVVLAGGCSSGGSTFSVADHIVATLVQFTSIDAVKIYDPDGQTGSPDVPGDSIPFCLEP